jgi:hypothetical protein
MTIQRRLGLSESLEEFAARNAHLTQAEARWQWRIEGLCLLFSAPTAGRHCENQGPRIASGLAVPVRMNGLVLTSADVIEVEP